MVRCPSYVFVGNALMFIADLDESQYSWAAFLEKCDGVNSWGSGGWESGGEWEKELKSWQQLRAECEAKEEDNTGSCIEPFEKLSLS